METTQRPTEINRPEKSGSKDIEDFISEGISSMILTNPEYNLNMKMFDKDKMEVIPPEDEYMNYISKTEETTKSGLTQMEESNEMRTNMDMFYMNSIGKSELDQNEFSYMKNMEEQLLFFENNPENNESNLSYQFGLIDNIKNSYRGHLSSASNYEYVTTPTSSPYNNNVEFSEDKSENNSKDFTKELTYGEHIIYNKIETLQRMIKNMILTMHEKYNTDSNLRYEALMNETVNESIYDFTLAQIFAQKNPKRSSLKLLASHGVIGSFFGSNGHRVQALQQEFNVNVSVTTKRIHFPGSNNKGVLLINGKLYNILKVLRPLYRAIQEEVIRLLIDESVKIEPAKIRLEIEVLIPESLRFTMDRNKHFKQIMEMTGANIRVIKQTYEDGPVQERVLVLFGSQNEIELALEKIALLIQDDSGFKHYSYMNYPDLTIALNANDYSLKYASKKLDIDSKSKKKYSP